MSFIAKENYKTNLFPVRIALTAIAKSFLEKLLSFYRAKLSTNKRSINKYYRVGIIFLSFLLCGYYYIKYQRDLRFVEDTILNYESKKIKEFVVTELDNLFFDIDEGYNKIDISDYIIKIYNGDHFKKQNILNLKSHILKLISPDIELLLLIGDQLLVQNTDDKILKYTSYYILNGNFIFTIGMRLKVDSLHLIKQEIGIKYSIEFSLIFLFLSIIHSFFVLRHQNLKNIYKKQYDVRVGDIASFYNRKEWEIKYSRSNV